MEDFSIIIGLFFVGLLVITIGTVSYMQQRDSSNYFIMPDGTVCSHYTSKSGYIKYHECENGNWYYNPEVVIVKNKKGG